MRAKDVSDRRLFRVKKDPPAAPVWTVLDQVKNDLELEKLGRLLDE